MTIDPRLANAALLTLAAYRVQQRRQVARTQPPNWQQTTGISALLEAARALPRRDPWAMPDLEPRDGLARLLAEARAWQKEERHGA
jgi:hypothetical protein